LLIAPRTSPWKVAIALPAWIHWSPDAPTLAGSAFSLTMFFRLLCGYDM
jgi:hypothetical protein